MSVSVERPRKSIFRRPTRSISFIDHWVTISSRAPLYKGARDEIVTQWSMKEIERVGLLKMDFLGLSTLTLIFDCVEEIARTTGERLDIANLPLDDAKAFQILQDGAAVGSLQ